MTQNSQGSAYLTFRGNCFEVTRFNESVSEMSRRFTAFQMRLDRLEDRYVTKFMRQALATENLSVVVAVDQMPWRTRDDSFELIRARHGGYGWLPEPDAPTIIGQMVRAEYVETSVFATANDREELAQALDEMTNLEPRSILNNTKLKVQWLLAMDVESQTLTIASVEESWVLETALDLLAAHARNK